MDLVPRTFCLDPEVLARNRGRVRAGDPALAPAAATLRRDADAARTAGPFTVVDKAVPAPSGDPHDYVSFGPYWWPDPETPDGLPYIRRDGERNPEFEDPARSDSPRLHALVEAVSALAEAYYLLGDVSYAERAAMLLRTWFLEPATRMNPHLEYGQAIPGRVTGRGIGIIDTSRLVSLVDDVGMLRGAPGWRPEDEAGVAAWFGAYLHWLLTSGHGRDERAAANNHGTWYDAQAASYALLAGREDLARDTVAGARALRIDSQIEPDGRQPHELARTRALSYSVFNLRALVCLAAIGEQVGVDLWGYRSPAGGSIRAAIDWLLPYAGGQAEWQYPQITPFDPLDLLPILYRARAAYGGDRYSEAIARLDTERVAAARATLLYSAGADVR
jgi:hypothetical protein